MKRTVLTTLAAAAVAVLSLGIISAPPAGALLGTTTTLSLSQSSVAYGSESTLTFTVGVSGVLNKPAGTVSIETPTSSTPLCTVSLPATTCTTTDTFLAASGSPYDVAAFYSANGLDSASHSAEQSLAITQTGTTTTLGLAPSSITYGQGSTVVFTAGVTSDTTGTPTGSIDIETPSLVDPLCTITLPATTCQTTDDPLAASVNPYSITASYEGDDNFTGSTSSPQDLTVGVASTSLTLSLSSSSVVVGDESALLATATLGTQFGGTPTGAVIVTAVSSPDSGSVSTTFCTITLPNTPTVCSPASGAALPVSGSPYQLTASYAGDANFMGSASAPQPLTVANGNSSTTLTISPATVTYGSEDGVTFTSNVSSTDPGIPTGTVAIMVGTTTLCTITLPATTCGTSATELPAATSPYQVVAAYSGDDVFDPSSSDEQDFTVQQAATTTNLTLPPSTSVVYGNEGSITFQPTVTSTDGGGGTPTGTVSVLAGTTTLCTFTLPSGTGCNAPDTSLPALGSPYSVTASYSGDTNFTGSTSSPAQDLMVGQATTTTDLTISPAIVTYGDESNVIFGVTIDPQYSGTPTGTVEIKQGTAVLCSFTLPVTQCSTSDDPLEAAPGSPYGITADYEGDTNFMSSISSTETLTVDQAVPMISLAVSPSSVSVGSESSVDFNVTLTQPYPGGTPSGLITVATTGSSPVTLCTISLPTTNFTCNTTDDALAPSTTPYQVTAAYSGDTNFTAVTSSAQDLTVTAVGTTTTLTPSATSVTYGDEQSVSFGVTVAADQTGGPALTGTVTVATPTTTLCTFDVTMASSCSTTATALDVAGSPYTITAKYSGDPNYSGSTSTSSSLTITQASTTAGLMLSSSTTTYGDEEAVTFTATLTPQFAGTPTGTITVATTGTSPITLCTITLPATTCSTSDNPLDAAPGSPYGITASYPGDANFMNSVSASQSLTVNQATTTTSMTLSQSTVEYGGESAVTFTVTVKPPSGAPAPTGTVTVSTSTTGPVCTITLPATTCSLGDETLAPSSAPYSVTASYPGDTNFMNSASASSPLTITGGTSTTEVGLSSSTVTYGDETSESVTVMVSPAPTKSGVPTGSATVTEGTTTLCVVTTLTNGAGSCSVTPATALTVSATPYAVVATYSGDDNFTKSASSPEDLTVLQATTGTALAVAPSTVTYAAESAVKFTATLTPQFTGTPTGTLTVATGSTNLCTITLPATTCTIPSPTALNAGAYTVTATYHGDNNFESSVGSGGLTVNQATPSSPNISNVPSGAAEEGSFTADVATNGDGSTSVVSQTTGTCTVGSDGHTVSFLVEGSCTLTPQITSGTNYVAATGSPQTFTIFPGPRGYWLVGSDGGIFSFGQAHFYGSMGGIPLQRPVVGITPTHDKHGYWLVASDGGIFSFGDSNFYGSIPGLGLHPAGSGQPNSLDAPIVGMVPSSDGNGYFMVASDGGVFAFGDAKFAGSCPGIGGCAGTAVAVMPDHSGNGYWLVTTAGNIYAFGDAPFFGAPAPQSSPVVNAVATTDGHGYWILYADGTVLSFGDASALGNPFGYVNSFNPATSIFPTSDGLGYWVASAKGDVFSYGNAPFLGSMSATPLNGPIIAAFGF